VRVASELTSEEVLSEIEDVAAAQISIENHFEKPCCFHGCGCESAAAVSSISVSTSSEVSSLLILPCEISIELIFEELCVVR